MKKQWYEPAQTFVSFDGVNYYDNDGFILVDPSDYDFRNGFFRL